MSEAYPPATTPADFVKGAPERIISITSGYTLQYGHPTLPNDVQRQKTLLSTDRIKETTGLLGVPNDSATNDSAVILSNGGLIHIYDDGLSITYTTPEVLGPERVAAADMAGIYVMQKFTEQESDRAAKQGGLFRRSGNYLGGVTTTSTANIKLFSPNGTVQPNTSSSEIMQTALALFTPLVANGMTGENGFEFSQKARGIGGNFAGLSATEGKKPFGSVMKHRDWDSVIIRSFDAVTSPKQRMLGAALVSIILRMLEHSSHNRNILSRLPVLENSGAAVKAISRDLSLETPLAVKGEHPQTVLGLLGRYLGAMRDFETDLFIDSDISLPNSEIQALTDAEYLCSIYEDVRESGDFAPLGEYLNLAARKEHIGKIVGSLASSNMNAFRYDLLWDFVGGSRAGTGLAYWNNASRDEITQNLTLLARSGNKRSTPNGTRSDLIASTIAEQGDEVTFASVSHVVMQGGKRVYVPNPYETRAA